MGRFRETLKYARRLLKDESGVLWWIPIVLFAASTVLGKQTQQRAASTQKHAYERAMALEFQQVKMAKEMDIEKIKELQKLNESRLEVAKASGFQQGSYTGPYFQVVNNR